MKKKSYLIRVILLLSIGETSFISACAESILDDSVATQAVGCSEYPAVWNSFPKKIRMWLPGDRPLHRGRELSQNSLIQTLKDFPDISWDDLSPHQKRLIGCARDAEVRWAEMNARASQRSVLSGAVAEGLLLSDDEYVRHVAPNIPRWLRTWLPSDLLLSARGPQADKNMLLSELRRIYNPSPESVHEGSSFSWGALDKFHKDRIEKQKKRMQNMHRRQKRKSRRQFVSPGRASFSGKSKASHRGVLGRGYSVRAYLAMTEEEDRDSFYGYQADEDSSAAEASINGKENKEPRG
ncbi:MAG: hypothetical protein H6849_03935 [Alphaproteobacteria bacterium]|nr:MAG: hypothetical protein H6849_03935 [Alphaproteobacteria bacterium]